MSNPEPMSDVLGTADLEPLVDAWISAHRDLIALARSLDANQWHTPTACPGWDVADLIAHVSSLEGLLVGRIDPPHEPDWDSLPHVRGDVGRLTEVGVDLRRGRPQREIVDELESIVDARIPDLRALTDPRQEVMSFFGPRPAAAFIRTRTFDTWAHEQDIRVALGLPGNLDSLGARATAGQLLDALCMVWGKKVGAAPGEALLLSVSGPGISGTWSITMSDDGRATARPAGEGGARDDSVTTTVEVSWPGLVDTMCGRGAVGGAQIDGQHAAALTEALVVTP